MNDLKLSNVIVRKNPVTGSQISITPVLPTESTLLTPESTLLTPESTLLTPEYTLFGN
jgi:hypothetical protein